MNSMEKQFNFIKLSLVSFCLCIGLHGFTQKIQFKQVTPLPPAPQITADFDNVKNSSIAFADIDGDNDLDVLISGTNESTVKVTKLYQNDGFGNFFLKSGNSFDDVYNSSIAFADIDGDNDQDVFITGWHTTNNRISKLYTNDGNGNFSIVTGTNFEEVQNGSIAFADVDGDSDMDLLITGNNHTNDGVTKLYLNNGLGSFTLAIGVPFDHVENSSIAFADVDNDNDQDVLITGRNTSNKLISKLYLNNGAGIFTLASRTPFIGVERSSIAFADIDGDNDQDLLITGRDSSSQKHSKLYRNIGSGNFTLVSNTPFTGVSNSSVSFADADGDNDLDVVITGHASSSPLVGKLYLNNGQGNFTLKSGTPLQGVFSSSIAFADIDGDNDQDLFITGDQGSSLGNGSTLYQNDGNANFKALSSVFPGASNASVAFADVDGDNDQDIFFNRIYQNDGLGNYSPSALNPFDAVNHSSIAFSDIEGDGDQDILITGLTSSNQKIAKLYRNNGTGTFTLVSGTPFDGVYASSIAFADVDGDSDQDVLIIGRNASFNLSSKLYLNNGSGNFTLKPNTPFDLLGHPSIAFADVDGDSDQDVLLTGAVPGNQKIAKLYQNDGLGNFSLVANTPFDGVYFSSVGITDVDGDSDQDIFISGYNQSGANIAKMYLNNGSGVFTLKANTPFDGVAESSVAFSDVDGDNDQDLLITGRNNLNDRIAKFYQNDGLGNFSLVTNTNLSGARLSAVAFADIDNDNFQDLFISGSSYSYPIANLYKSSTCQIDRDTNFITVCDSLVWIDGISYTASTNNAQHILNNAAGCDSIITLDLTVLPQLSSTKNISVCHGGSFLFNGTTYDANHLSGTEVFSNIGPFNCDSLVYVNLNILPQLSSIRNETLCFGDSIIINGTSYNANNLSGTETYNNIGPLNCDSIVNVSLNILPQLSSLRNDTLCFGGSIVVNGTSYNTNNLSGTETFNNIGSFNCDSTVSVAITVLPRIDTSISISGIHLTANQNGAQYQWLDCNNGNSIIPSATNQSFSPIANGSYSVIVNLNGCSDTSNCFPVIGVGIIKNDFNNKMKIFPNPTNGNFSVDLGEMYSSISITISDLNGRLIQNKTFSKRQVLSLKIDQPAGIYLLNIQSGGKKALIRLLKE